MLSNLINVSSIFIFFIWNQALQFASADVDEVDAIFKQAQEVSTTNQEDYTCTAEFKPIVKLKALEEVKTGEEDETVLSDI